jgi:hypothetical protein
MADDELQTKGFAPDGDLCGMLPGAPPVLIILFENQGIIFLGTDLPISL